jgi:hypothetical protein
VAKTKHAQNERVQYMEGLLKGRDDRGEKERLSSGEKVVGGEMTTRNEEVEYALVFKWVGRENCGMRKTRVT